MNKEMVIKEVIEAYRLRDGRFDEYTLQKVCEKAYKEEVSVSDNIKNMMKSIKDFRYDLEKSGAKRNEYIAELLKRRQNRF